MGLLSKKKCVMYSIYLSSNTAFFHLFYNVIRDPGPYFLLEIHWGKNIDNSCCIGSITFFLAVFETQMLLWYPFILS